MVTSGIVIDRITRVGDVGEPGYSAYGQSLRKCTYSGSKDHWHGATQYTLSELLPTCYITESVYSYLTTAEIQSVRSRIQGIVPNSYAHKVYGGIDSFYKSYYCWEFLDGIEAIPLPVPCEPGDIEYIQCEDGSRVKKRLCNWLHEWVNYEDDCEHCIVGGQGSRSQVCADGSVIGTHVCTDGVWVPIGARCPDDEIDDGIDDEIDAGEPDDITPVDDDEYPPKSELATDLSSIFGDIDMKWIIIAVIAAVLGLLS